MNYTLEKLGNGSAEMLLKVLSAQRRTIVRKKICKFNDSFQSQRQSCLGWKHLIKKLLFASHKSILSYNENIILFSCRLDNDGKTREKTVQIKGDGVRYHYEIKQMETFQ